MRWPEGLLPAVPLALLLALAGCATVAERAGERFADDLAHAVFAHDDPATIRDALPAYLLLLDARLVGDAPSAAVLLAAARLYGAYAGSFVEEPSRAQRLGQRALDYAWRAQCVLESPLCDARGLRFDVLEPRIAAAGAEHLAATYVLATSWAGWIQAHREDWNAIADIPKVQRLLERVVALDPEHDRGMPHVYLGVLHSLRPAALGGTPDEGRRHFERAIAVDDGNLMAKVLFAEFHARLLFDRELHDRLLAGVLQAEPVAPGLTLMNTLARQRARALLDSADAYF